MGIDIDRIRLETPGVAHVNHLDAAGSALMPQPVIDAVANHWALEARIGGYGAHTRNADELDAVYDAVATFIGADRREIAVLENATAAWSQAFYALRFEAGDRILTCQAEYGANYVAFLQRAKRDGIVIDVIPSDTNGVLDVEALRQMIDERVALIAITWIPTNGGLVNPVEEVGRIAIEHDILFLLDACQAVGQMPVNVSKIGCDFLTATGRKFLRGPRGTGLLYVRRDLIEALEPIMIDHFAAPWIATDRYELRTDARRFENWENTYALRAGLRAAVEYAADLGIESIRERAWMLADHLRHLLARLPGVEIRDLGEQQCAIVSFTMEGKDPNTVVADLRRRDINIGASDPSSTRLDAQFRELPTLLRASPHYYNTVGELEALVTALADL